MWLQGHWHLQACLLWCLYPCLLWYLERGRVQAFRFPTLELKPVCWVTVEEVTEQPRLTWKGRNFNNVTFPFPGPILISDNIRDTTSLGSLCISTGPWRALSTPLAGVLQMKTDEFWFTEWWWCKLCRSFVPFDWLSLFFFYLHYQFSNWAQTGSRLQSV